MAPSRSGKAVEYTGYALIATGIFAAVMGGYYIHVDGDAACCNQVRDTKKYGLPIALVGGVAVVGGASLLVWRFWPASTTVAVSPWGIALAGQF
jgi:hypothetical protein